MSRVTLDMPEKFTFSCLIPVRITDINYGNHVGNDAFVSILHEARVQFLASIGYSELNIDGNGLIMADLKIKFKRESLYRDILTVEMAEKDLTNSGFDLYYQISTERESMKVIIAQAKTAQVCYNYKQKRIARLPDDFKNALTNLI